MRVLVVIALQGTCCDMPIPPLCFFLLYIMCILILTGFWVKEKKIHSKRACNLNFTVQQTFFFK